MGDAKRPGQTQSKYPYLGESFSWDNGLTVTLSKPKAYKPSQYVLEYEEFPYRSFVVVTVTVANGSLEPYDPACSWSRSSPAMSR